MQFKGISDLSLAHIADQMKDSRIAKIRKGAQSVYVGTYGKYNSGDLTGAWLDLQDYSSMEEFYDAAKTLHSDEADPELMFQDWEGVPSWAISESHISEDFWQILEAIPDEDVRDAFDAYVDNILGGQMSDVSDAISSFEAAYVGKYDSMEDYARDYIDGIGLDNIENRTYFIDNASMANDLRSEGWIEVDQDNADSNPEEFPDGPGIYDPIGYFYGFYDSLEDVVNDWLDEGFFSEDLVQQYFDYSAFAKELSHDYSLIDVYLFHNY